MTEFEIKSKINKFYHPQTTHLCALWSFFFPPHRPTHPPTLSCFCIGGVTQAGPAQLQRWPVPRLHDGRYQGPLKHVCGLLLTGFVRPPQLALLFSAGEEKRKKEKPLDLFPRTLVQTGKPGAWRGRGFSLCRRYPGP